MWCSFLFFKLIITAVNCLKVSEAEIRYAEGRSSAVIMLLLCTCFLSTIVYYVLLRNNIPIPLATVVMVGCILWGVGAYHSDEILKISNVVNIKPKSFFQMYLPVITFTTAFCLEFHTFRKSLHQILVISIPVAFLYAIFLGFLLSEAASYFWHYTICIAFGVLSIPIYPTELIRYLNKIGSETKHTRILLEGEIIIGLESAGFSFFMMKAYFEKELDEVHEIILAIVYNCILEPFLGFIFGLLGRRLMRKFYNDPTNLMLVCLSIPFIAFNISSYTSAGVVCVTIVGIMMSIERTSLPHDMNELVVVVWRAIVHLANCAIMLRSAVKFSTAILPYMEVHNFVHVFLSFLLSSIGRFISFLLFAPVLSRIGYGITFQNMIVCVWGGVKSPICLTSALRLMQTMRENHASQIIFMHTVCLFLLSSLVFGTLTPLILHITAINKVSIAKRMNMNRCLDYIMAKRTTVIAVLKMDRFFADANWPVVNKETEMKHPYTYKASANQEERDDYIGLRSTVCPDCKKQITNEPTAKEFHEMTREARLKILKCKRISYIRQHENGMLSQNAVRTLLQAVEVGMDSEEALIEIDGLHKMFTTEGCLKTFVRKQINDICNPRPSIPPKKYWRYVCYKIVNSFYFNVFTYTVIIIYLVPTILQFVYPPQSKTEDIIYFVVNLTLLIIYSIEFFLRISSYWLVYFCKEAVVKYFRSFFNCLDFIVLVTAAVDVFIDFADLLTANKNYSVHTAFSALKLLRLLFLLKFVRLSKSLTPKLAKFVNSQIDQHMAYVYEVGKGYLTGEEEVLEGLIQMTGDDKILLEIKNRLEQDRLTVTKLLGVAQMERPWIATTVKTKQGIRAVLNFLQEAIEELKISGRIDDVEYNLLLNSLNRSMKYWSSITYLEPCQFKDILWNMSWIRGEREIFDFLMEHVSMKVYNIGDPICIEGQISDGILIVISGLLSLNYTPTKKTLSNLGQYGWLPIVDYVSPAKFTEHVTDYIVSGNSMGELSILTGRPYDCIIKAETECRICLLRRDFLKRAMEMSANPIDGLQCRIWRAIGIRIAFSVLLQVPSYKVMGPQKLKFVLERSFMAQLNYFKTFIVSELIEDIVLIEGVIVDFETKRLYLAPCYIPRTAKKLILPKSSQIKLNRDVETKLLIIPQASVHEYDLMLNEEDMCELISISSSKCLHHIIKKRHGATSKKNKLKVRNKSSYTMDKYGWSRSNISWTGNDAG